MAAVDYNYAGPRSEHKSQINASRNGFPSDQGHLRFPSERVTAKSQPFQRAQSFPGGRQLIAFSEFREDRNELGSGLFSSPGNYPDSDQGFHDQEQKRLRLPAIIQEDASELVNHQLSAGVGSPHTSVSAAWAPIKGHGLPSTLDLPKSVAEPSEITDLGHQRYNELKNENRVPSFPIDDEAFADGLADRIFDASRENSRDRKDFLPQSQLDRLIHTRSVALELKRWLPRLSEYAVSAYANRICHGTAEAFDMSTTEDMVRSFQKVFAILVLINKVDHIELFLKENVSDADLPLQRRIEEEGCRRKFNLRRRKEPDQQLDCFGSWDQITIRNFEEYQWVMIPPFFAKGKRKNVQHYVLEPSTVLPFTFTKDTNKKSGAKEHRGGYSLVYQAHIHPDHHNFNTPEDHDHSTPESQNTFAVKRLDSPSKEAFQKEVQILKKFSGDAHPHLISLLATFERNHTFYLIFPWAGADLMTYWKYENPKPAYNADTIIWMAEQCSGLAGGLAKLHQYETGLKENETPKNEFLAPGPHSNWEREPGRHGQLYGRHGDIKPENILWFPALQTSRHNGTLKVSDFGLSELNSRYSKSKRRSQVPNSPTYRPPECDLRQKIIKQSYDIWTLGCLYLEFIAWTLGGWDLVSQFTRRRRSTNLGEVHSDCFFEIREGGKAASADAFVKPAVLGFVSELRSRAQGSNFLTSFLDMVMTEMLIVESERDRRTDAGMSQNEDLSPAGAEGSISADEDFGDHLLGCLIESKFDTRQEFLPEKDIGKIITRNAIHQELFRGKEVAGHDEDLITFIDTRAKKVFATAYYVLVGDEKSLLNTMIYFQSCEFTDESLPIENLQVPRTQEACQTKESQARLPSPFDRIVDPQLRRIWARIKVRKFYQNQWKFLAPVFSSKKFHYILPVGSVLPFVWVNKIVKEGRFSRVHEIRIHEDHQEPLNLTVDGQPAHVAVKEILTNENDDELQQEVEQNFQIEAKALSEITSLDHDHIIERIAAITIGSRHYFMFPWADGGNLREFWKEYPNPNLSTNLIRQSMVQLRSIADALECLHHYNKNAHYRHGDLKPENILRFKNETVVGTLKIADMGLAKRHTEVTDARLAPTSTKYGTTRYEPPEAATNQLKARSRLYDVWSLGCIMLEYIIWLLHGYGGVQQFNDEIYKGNGCFYLVEQGGDQTKAEVHPTVIKWMNSLSNHQECSTQTAIRNLLELVRNRLLVVALQTGPETNASDISPTLFKLTPADPAEKSPAGSFRAKATTVCSALDGMLDLGEGNQTYLLSNERPTDARRHSMAAIPRFNDLLRPPTPTKQRANDARVVGQSQSYNSEDMTCSSRISDVPTPLLSLVRVPGGSSVIPPYVQIGYPNLPPTRHRMHFETVKQWLKDCDENSAHDNCQFDNSQPLPTRLLDVGGSKIRLIETQNSHGKYLALSHPWGDPDKYSHFCTYTHNIEDYKENIDFNALPKTFQDAVTLTRQLNVQYLWIDSLCIIQGSDGDFTEQSKHMEDVFSSAYCVIAASRASGQGDGFLGERPQRDYVTFNRGGDTYHICEEIDNFQTDVIDGPLNQRGWVLQERALARRTIYFTKNQTYWECGGGIRCETFTRLRNNIAAFLGDSKFPEVAMNSKRGDRIYLYQMFYKQYSKLQFSKIEDRPFAIAGLEKRLIQGFGAHGGYGVLDDGKGLLHRSLLWHRPSNGTLDRIKFPPEKRIFVPTWSWMAYEGGIDYLDPEWSKTDWEQHDLRSPWSADSPFQYTTDKNSTISLNATAREFDQTKAAKEQITLYFDMPDKTDCSTSCLKCVILARPKAEFTTTDTICHVLVVAPQAVKRPGGIPVYERVGVGKMPESCVSQLDEIEVRLQ
ncbi:HET-domain-containing protein [Colletotrichum asianum]